MSEILEIGMLIAFGASWPLNVRKSLKAKTTKGKSLAFLILILSGYVCGICSKLTNVAYMASFSDKWYVLCVYILNFIMVSADLFVYIYNYNVFDKKKERNT